MFISIKYRSMENISLIHSNSCCNAILKLKCWLILAKYGASKLEIVKQLTQDAALDEFEVRLHLKKRLSAVPDIFTAFMRSVFDKTMKYVSNYICSPDWSIFLENGNDSLWLLNNVIREEILIASSLFTSVSHTNCKTVFYSIKNEIFSVIDSWSDAITFSYSNFISATLSNIFVHKMKDLIMKYESAPQNVDIRWLYEDILKLKRPPQLSAFPEGENSLWFINISFGLDYFNENNIMDEFCFYTENELSHKLADWLFVECLNEFRSSTERVLQQENEGKFGARIYGKEKLSTLLDLPVCDLELQLMMSEDQFCTDVSVAEGPHYYVPVPDLTTLQTCKIEQIDEVHSNPAIKNSFDLLDSVFQDYGDAELNNKISDIKIELDEFCSNDRLQNSNYPIGGNSNVAFSSQKSYEWEEPEQSPKSQVSTKPQTQEVEHGHACPTVPKRRGRPRKIDEYNHTSLKNSQHKYSQENVLDCSNWISDNFFEVAGNKPAIDRARLYELYTNYCLLKLCTPVDRALFGKIIRKVFPKLRSRRLIQNQVLKYHYVGLKPKFAELELALLHSDLAMNPREILLSYMPVDNS